MTSLLETYIGNHIWSLSLPQELWTVMNCKGQIEVRYFKCNTSMSNCISISYLQLYLDIMLQLQVFMFIIASATWLIASAAWLIASAAWLIASAAWLIASAAWLYDCSNILHRGAVSIEAYLCRVHMARMVKSRHSMVNNCK